MTRERTGPRVVAAVRRGPRRTPVVLQASATECGLACLAMVLGHHGHHTSIRELRKVCPPGRDGVSAGAIARAARQAGLEATGYAASLGVVEQLPGPTIAHWEDGHFVVVQRVTGRHVDIVDPAVGRRRLSRAEFESRLGKVVLQLEPGDGFTARKSREAFWRSYATALLRVPGTVRLMAQVLAVTVVLQALVVAMPLATRTVVDRSGELRDTPLLTLFAIGIAAVTVAQLLSGLLRSSLLVHLQGRLDSAALLSFAAHLLRLPLRYFEQRSTGDIMTRFASIAVVRELMTRQTLGSLLDACLVLGYLGVLAVVYPPVALAVGLVLAAVLGLLLGMTRAVRERMAADLTNQGIAQGYLVEALEGIGTVKAAAAEDRVLERVGRLLTDWMAATLRRSYLAAVIESVTTALRVLTPLLVLWLCASRVQAGAMTTGTMLAVTWLASSVVTPLATVVANGQQLQLAGAQLQRLADILDTPAEPAGTGAPEHRLRGRIDVVGVSYRYDPYSPPILADVDVRVRPGERVAIVGATGSGKTTLGMLLLGLYSPDSGQISYDSVPLGELAPRALRSQVGVVLQEPFVFSGTIRDNITMHDPAISDAEVHRAATIACLHDEVMAMPSGYRTLLAPRGAGLSGGQRQRLALARALVRRPAILLLDEATSHLDGVTEERIHRNLARLDCVQVVIAHRLSTVRDADQILLLHGGRVAEQGTHAELVARQGRYARLVATQLDGGDVDARPVAKPPVGSDRTPHEVERR